MKKLLTDIKKKRIIGLKTFHIGLLLLASAPNISFILLLISSIIGSLNREDIFYKDRYNKPFIVVGILMFLSCVFVSLKGANFPDQEISLTWIGLANWLPFFWCFWSFQIYLINKKLRISASKFLLFGSIPVVITGLSQYFLNWYGPYSFLNNLIIWFQRPLSIGSGVTGLFNNYNYFGAWLAIVLPLCLGFLIKENNNKINKIFFSLVSILIAYMIILSTSRSSILSIFLIIILLLTRIKRLKIIYTLMLFTVGILIINFIPYLSKNLQESIFLFFPATLIDKTSLLSLIDINSFPRIDIWVNSLELIKDNWFFGYGGGSFHYFYDLYGKYDGIQHTHNIFLEIAFNYGLPSALIISISIILILKKISNKFFSKNLEELSEFDRLWIISFLVFIFIHMFDITYFDGRISLLSWILLAGIKQVNNENKL